MRAQLPVGVAISLGVAFWFLTVVLRPDDATSFQAFWWLMIGAAAALGALFGRGERIRVAVGLGLPPLLLAPWTAPRGDGDGLWVLWFPMLAAFIVVLAFVADLGSMARAHWSRPD